MSDRGTPFDLVFGDTGLAAEHFPRIAAALEPLGGTLPERELFLTLGPVADLMGELVPEAGEGTAQIALLAFHAFQRWRAGGEDWRLDQAQLRRVLELAPIGAWQLEPPAPAGYVCLPRHQLWVAGTSGQPAEPVEGFFWVAGSPAVNALDLLLVLGLHEGRPGMTVIELSSGPLPADGHWGDLQVREAARDFANVLPGGEHLHGLSTAGEAFKLASRVFRHLTEARQFEEG